MNTDETNKQGHTTARGDGPELRSGEWVAEVEAAREHIAARWRRYSQERMDEPEAIALYEAMTALDRLIDMERRPSATGQDMPLRTAQRHSQHEPKLDAKP